jgi:hypothetical protein
MDSVVLTFRYVSSKREKGIDGGKAKIIRINILLT